MSHQISIEYHKGQNNIIEQIIGISCGAGEDKKIVLLTNYITLENGYVVYDGKNPIYLGKDFDEAIKKYNSVEAEDES